jgi:hypothetical protein
MIRREVLKCCCFFTMVLAVVPLRAQNPSAAAASPAAPQTSATVNGRLAQLD